MATKLTVSNQKVPSQQDVHINDIPSGQFFLCDSIGGDQKYASVLMLATESRIMIVEPIDGAFYSWAKQMGCPIARNVRFVKSVNITYELE